MDADGVALKEHVLALVNEKDAKYQTQFEARDKAIAAALAAQDRATAAALVSAEKAVAKAEESQLRVNIGQNEFRGALKDYTASLVTRAEVEQWSKAMEDKVAAVTERLNLQAGRSSGVNGTWVAIGSVVTILLVLASLLIALR